jgi:hypothetical protein
MLKDGDFSHIELMMGTNQDEGKRAHDSKKIGETSGERTHENGDFRHMVSDNSTKRRNICMPFKTSKSNYNNGSNLKFLCR